MLSGPLLAAITTNPPASPALATESGAPGFGLIFWVLVLVGSAALVVVIERILYLHRVQIDSAQFLAGVRNVIRRDNVIEALSICDATPGPVARLVKAAILNRDGGRERIDEVIEEIGQSEVPRLEHNLPLLATIAQVAPLLGLMGTLLGFGVVFRGLRGDGTWGAGYAAPGQMFDGLMQALYTAAVGIGIAAFCYAAYNYLVHRVNLIVLDMEKASRDAVRLALGDSGSPGEPGRNP